MIDIPGTPGTVTGLVLRISQCVFAAGSISYMVTSSGFFSFTAFCSLCLIPSSLTIAAFCIIAASSESSEGSSLSFRKLRKILFCIIAALFTFNFPFGKSNPVIPHQICHRDLKLENTLLDGSPAPLLKICDSRASDLDKEERPEVHLLRLVLLSLQEDSLELEQYLNVEKPSTGSRRMH